MNKETFTFANAHVELTVIDNLFYIQVSGIFTDEIALTLLNHMNRLFEQSPGDPIRVWDPCGIPAGGFLLSSQCVDRIVAWSQALKARRPGAMAYMISPTGISFGMSRMYQLKANAGNADIVVLQSLEDLPAEIRSKLPT